jgi:hypothetical protein
MLRFELAPIGIKAPDYFTARKIALELMPEILEYTHWSLAKLGLVFEE